MRKRGILTGLFLLLSMTAQAGERVVIPMQKFNTGTYYVNVSLGEGEASRFMVDTGSGYVVIKQGLMNELLRYKQARYLRQVRLALADGGIMNATIYQVANLTIDGRCRLENIEVVVLPRSGKNILGLSALGKAAPFTISIQPSTLTLANCLAK